MHAHLDLVGGLAGDMFAAALLDLWPALEAPLRADLAAAGLAAHARIELVATTRQGLAARHLAIDVAAEAAPTGRWSEIKTWLESADLDASIKGRALRLFSLLAEAEAEVHGVSVQEVHFHEVADWDSLIDVVAAASLIARAPVTGWSVGPVPMGRGRVRSAHGLLPLPAPAAAALLEGFDVVDDGREGERVTPTGAAILRHLTDRSGRPPTGRLVGTGTGAGRRELAGLANVARVLLIDPEGATAERVAELAFEIDDMTPEELGVALDRLRATAGVLDTGFHLRVGKKGRPQFAVSVLAQPHAIDTVVARCFDETSTLGLRIAERERRVLQRNGTKAAGRRVKRAERPGGTTLKVESDDLAAIASLAARRRAAREAEDG